MVPSLRHQSSHHAPPGAYKRVGKLAVEGNQRTSAGRRVTMPDGQAAWPRFAAALVDGRVPECSGSAAPTSRLRPVAAGGTSIRRRSYCYWRKVALVNVTEACPRNRKCGRTERRWLPPPSLTGFREFDAQSAARCLRGRWLVLVGDSHARTLLNVLLFSLGRSPWPYLHANESLWASTAWPSLDTLGLCSGGRAGARGDAAAGAVDGSPPGSRGALIWNATSRGECTRDYHLPHGTRLSFVFVGRLSRRWGTLCELAASGGLAPDWPATGGGARHGNGRARPDAIVVSHSAWPMLDGSTCDHAAYAHELRRLLRLLVWGRLDVTSTTSRDVALWDTPCRRLVAASSTSHSAATPTTATRPAGSWSPLVFWLAQPRMQAPVAKRCLAGGAWLAAQRAALETLEKEGVSVRRLDSWHLVDAAETCTGASACASRPSPRLRDHGACARCPEPAPTSDVIPFQTRECVVLVAVHYHLPVYAALAQQLLNWACSNL
jgi:hypothetical protein